MKTAAELIAERRAQGLTAADLPREPAVYWPPNIADTCCGKCEGATCYVDFLTGERE